MTIAKNTEGTSVTIAVEGRLDNATAPQLEDALKDLSGVTDLVIDMAHLAYLSSAGLRVLLNTLKVMNQQGRMAVRNVSETIMDVLEVTGFVDFLTIEQD